MATKLLVCLSVLLCVSFASVSANDCPYYDALSEFYTATGGPNWIDKTGWLGDDCPCSADGMDSWYGLGCISGVIEYMTFNQNNLVGTLPSGFFTQMTKLSGIDLGDNKLSGTLPEDIGTLKFVKNVLLYNNSFTGSINSLESLSSAWEINLKNNQFSGSFPAFQGMSSMTNFFASNNTLQGTVPESFFKNPVLGIVDLSNNQLSGTLPELGVSDLKFSILKLNNNQLSGTIPSWISSRKCPNLDVVDLSKNQFAGGIPLYTAPSFVRSFNVSFNQLDQEIPSSFVLPIVSYFDISHNEIPGSIPSFLGSVENPHLFTLSHNKLNGSVPQSFSILNNLASFYKLDLSHNELSGPVPAFWNTTPSYELDISHNRFDCPLPTWCSDEADGGNGMCAPCGSGSSSPGSSGLTGGEITLIVFSILFAILLALCFVGAFAIFMYKKLPKKTYEHIGDEDL